MKTFTRIKIQKWKKASILLRFHCVFIIQSRWETEFSEQKEGKMKNIAGEFKVEGHY
jgi:hypothetical protein